VGGAWQRGEHVAYVCSEDRVVLVDLDQSPDTPQILSESAAAVWQAIDGARDTAGIVDVVAASYGLEPEVIAPDVIGFLHTLERQGLITV